jgi:hypothetical protein
VAEQPNGDQAQQQQGQASAGAQQGADTQSQQQQGERTVPYDRFKQVNDELATLKREKAQADQQRQADEEQRLAQQNQFKELAESRQSKIAELEPRAAQAERYEAALKKHLEGLRRDVPEHLLPLLDRMDPAEQLDYLAENRDKLAPASSGTSGQQTQARPGNGGSTQRPAGVPDRREVIQQEVTTRRSSGGYAAL